MRGWSLFSGAATFNIDPTCSYIYPLVNMFLFFERPPLGMLNGVVSTDRMELNGTVSGPGFSGPAEFTMVGGRFNPMLRVILPA